MLEFSEDYGIIDFRLYPAANKLDGPAQEDAGRTEVDGFMVLKRRSFWLACLIGAGIVAVYFAVTVFGGQAINREVTESGANAYTYTWLINSAAVLTIGYILTCWFYARMPWTLTGELRGRPRLARIILVVRILSWVMLSTVAGWQSDNIKLFLLTLVIAPPVIEAFGLYMLSGGELRTARYLALAALLIEAAVMILSLARPDIFGAIAIPGTSLLERSLGLAPGMGSAAYAGNPFAQAAGAAASFLACGGSLLLATLAFDSGEESLKKDGYPA